MKGLRDRVSAIEHELEQLTGELRTLEESFAQPGLYISGADVADLTKRYEAGKRKRARLESAWAEAMQTLESAE
jgi:hypothetical protein